MRFQSLAAAFLVVVAPLAAAGEQAGDLPTNNQAVVPTVSVEVIATGGHADTADQAAQAATTPHADYAVSAGSAGTAGSATNLSPPDCPSVGNWYYTLDGNTGQLRCVRDGGERPDD